MFMLLLTVSSGFLMLIVVTLIDFYLLKTGSLQ